jgi:hypothetical protein
VKVDTDERIRTKTQCLPPFLLETCPEKPFKTLVSSHLTHPDHAKDALARLPRGTK